MESYRIAYEGVAPEARPVEDLNRVHRVRGARGGQVTAKEFREYLASQRGRVVHSDGFLSLSDAYTAYECKCGFVGIFKSDKCARCGEILAEEAP